MREVCIEIACFNRINTRRSYATVKPNLPTYLGNYSMNQIVNIFCRGTFQRERSLVCVSNLENISLFSTFLNGPFPASFSLFFVFSTNS